MHVGLVGLGKMGNNMRERMRRAGLTVVGYDRNPANFLAFLYLAAMPLWIA